MAVLAAAAEHVLKRLAKQLLTLFAPVKALDRLARMVFLAEVRQIALFRLVEDPGLGPGVAVGERGPIAFESLFRRGHQRSAIAVRTGVCRRAEPYARCGGHGEA